MVALALAPSPIVVAFVTIGNRKYQFHHVCVFTRVLCGVWCVQTPRLRHHKLVTRWCVCVCATLCVGCYYTIDTTPYIICYLLFAIIVNKQRATSDGKAHTCSASNEIPLSIHTTRATAHAHITHTRLIELRSDFFVEPSLIDRAECAICVRCRREWK